MSRIQLALNVDDVRAATELYAKLFSAAPAKTGPGYANFAIADPPLKLVLLEDPGHGGTLSHLGVEAGSTGAVNTGQQRPTEAGLAAADERETTCCYVTQDKLWVRGTPGDERWEFYTVPADGPTRRAPGMPAMTSSAPGSAGLARVRHLEKMGGWTRRERLRFLWYRLRLTVQEMNYATRRVAEMQMRLP